MGMKNWIFYIIAISYVQFGFSQLNKIEDYDSIVSYQVKKKETLFNISKKFKINIEDIFQFNPELRDQKLRKNSIISIPLKKIKKNIYFDSSINQKTIDENKLLNQINNNKNPKKNNINLAFLAPIKIDEIQYDSINQTKEFLKKINLTTISIDFYNGMKMAIEEESSEDVRINLDVFDTKNRIDVIKDLKENMDFNNYDFVIGPLITRNFNYFNSNNIKTKIVSPLITSDVELRDNTIITTAPDSLKRKFVFEMIDEMIELKNDQCVLIISDQKNEKTKNELLIKFPNAEKIDINDEKLFVDPKITDSLMYDNKENWVFLETNRSNVISSVSSLLNSQINEKRKIKLISSVSVENYDNPNISYEKLGNLNFIYPSDSFPDQSDALDVFKSNFLDQIGKYPNRVSIKAYDLIKDLLQRFIYYRNYTGFDIDYETSLLNNKYNYKEIDEQGLRNQSFYIIKHKELQVIDLTNK
tara:strand:+ start:2512 stop:3927 length:1416 start_codon:yes stop_codon:yes gene_type:complete